MRPWSVQCSKERYTKLAKSLALSAMVDPRPVLGKDRGRQYQAIRWEAWRLLHEAGCSYLQIAKASNYDHTTIMYALKPEARVERRLRHNVEFRSKPGFRPRGPYRVRPIFSPGLDVEAA